MENKPGFIRAMWCGDEACELKIKEDTTGYQPLHALRAGEDLRRVRLLRKAREETGLLG